MAKSKLQRNLSNYRRTLRKMAEALARTHKGCNRARGCGCFTDQSISVYELAERKLFEIELASYASGGQKDGGGYDHYDAEKFMQELDAKVAAPSEIAGIVREEIE